MSTSDLRIARAVATSGSVHGFEVPRVISVHTAKERRGDR